MLISFKRIRVREARVSIMCYLAVATAISVFQIYFFLCFQLVKDINLVHVKNNYNQVNSLAINIRVRPLKLGWLLLFYEDPIWSIPGIHQCIRCFKQNKILITHF